MTLSEKIKILEEILSLSNESYSDTFKNDIIIFFEDDFNESNLQLEFLNKLQMKEEIQIWVDKLLSRFVMKFDPDGETENDFIHDYLVNG